MSQDKQDSVYRIGDDDVEGHRMGTVNASGGDDLGPEGIKSRNPAAGDDDVEGHRMGTVNATGDDDDVEGHRMGTVNATGDDDDVEGHRMGTVNATGDDEMDPDSMKLRH